jgi:proteasome lid subunit RPN8/RPN11
MASRIKISVFPPDMTQPVTTPFPADRASRWNSPYDGGSLEPLVDVFLTQPAYSRICVHSASDLQNEVGGVLVGEWCVNARQGEQFILIEHALPARHTRQGSIYLTFTQESLIDIHEQIDMHHQGKKIVGWYHTHPRMGIFLSHYDTWLHNNFFPEPWQVALVVEPHTSLGGFFVRQRAGVLDPGRYFGFYEMDGSFGRSMVHWKNLTQTEEQQKEGGPSHE